MAAQKHFDYIIAGGGCAGLSLVYHLLQAGLKDKEILIIEKDKKDHNDRTWCFWEKEVNPFEQLVFHRWQHMYFYGDGYDKQLNLSPYFYKMIRGADFYNYVNGVLTQHKNVSRLQEPVESIADREQGGEVVAGGIAFRGNWVFNSIPAEHKKQITKYPYLLQHFKGWVVKTEKPTFNPAEATLMDFRVPQHGDCRFAYVLPTDTNTALVEYTVFSENLLPQQEYDAALYNYLKRFLVLQNYAIEHEEYGVIPMTSMPFARQAGRHIINIGTAGGLTKPSTGYTFLRIQQDTQKLAEHMTTTGKPLRYQSGWNHRFKVYDSALLHVIAGRLYPADGVFTHLFKNNPTDRILKFLDEETNFWEEIKVAGSVPRLPFVKGLLMALSRIG